MTFDEAPDYVQKIILATIQREKGVSNNPDDPGGLTKDGITADTAKRYGYDDVTKLTDEQIKDIYLKYYFLDYHFDRIATISPQLAEELFDTGVNIGPSLPVIWLQTNLNLLSLREAYYPYIDEDGLIGDKTISALNSFIKKRGKKLAVKVLYNQLNAIQGSYYFHLAKVHDKYQTFYYGWLLKRCNYIA